MALDPVIAGIPFAQETPTQEPPQTNVTYLPAEPEPEIAPGTPTLAEIREYNRQNDIVNPVLDLSAEEIANLATSDPDHFNLEQSLIKLQPHWDSELIRKSAEAYNLLERRGWKPPGDFGASKLPGMAVEAATGTVSYFASLFKGALGIPMAMAMEKIDELSGLPPSPGALKVRQGLQREIAETGAASESSVTGLAFQGAKAFDKLFGKNPELKTDQDKIDSLKAALIPHLAQQKIVSGEGPITQATQGGIVAELAQADLPVRPEEVEAKLMGDPFAFLAFGKGLQGVGALFGMAKPLATAAAKLPGVRAIAPAVAATAAKIPSATQVGGKAIELAGTVTRKLAPVTGTVAVAGPVIAAAAASPLTLGQLASSAILGQASGIARISALGRGIQKGIAVTRRLGARLEKVGREVAGKEAVTGAVTQGIRDVLQSLPSAAGHVGHGAALDIGLAALTSTTPEDTHALQLGTIFGVTQGLRKTGAWVASGQRIAPRAWGAKGQVATSKQLPALESMSDAAYSAASPAVRERVNAVRQFLKGVDANTDVFLADSTQVDSRGVNTGVEKALIDSGFEPATAEFYAKQNGFFDAAVSVPGKPGETRRAIVLANSDSAPHEAKHAFQDVIGEQANQVIDSVIRDTYADQWESLGQKYTEQLLGRRLRANESWRDTILEKSGDGDAAATLKSEIDAANQISAATGARATAAGVAAIAPTPRRGAWRETLTPEEARAVADKYIAREIAAENFDAVFKNLGASLAERTGIIPWLAKIVSSTTEMLGGDSLRGRTSEVLQTPLKADVIEAVKGQVRGRQAEKPVVTPEIKAPTVATRPGAPIGTPEEEAKNTADVAAAAPERPTGPEVDAQSPREILGTFSEAKAAGHGVKITRRTAPGTPAGAIEVSRGKRREQIETARGIPDDQKPLWEKNFTPVKTVVTKKGIQEQGWSPEVLAANAEKTAKFLSDVNLSASPFEIDPTTKTFTASGWQNLFDKVNIYAGNQAVGLTGKGTPLEIGRAREFGFDEPTGTREAVGTLTDAEANFLNYLMGYPLPGKGATVKKKGAKQYGLQLISEATEPGRAQPLVVPRGGRTFEGKEAEQLGFVGEQLLEVNPLRAQIEQAARDAGVKPPSPIEVWQNLNVRDIVKAEIAPELPAIRPVGVTARAGFNPKQLVTPEKEKQFSSSAVRFADGTLKPVFHATVADFDPVNITTDAFQAHFGSPAAAAARVLGPMLGRNAEAAFDETGAKTMPVFLDIKNPLKLPDIGNWESANDVARAIYEKFGAKLPKMLKPDYVQRTVDSFVEDYISIGVEEAAAHARANLEEINALKQWVEDQGYDGIVYENEFEAPPKIQGEFFSSEMGYEYGQDSYIAFSNEQIKSAIGPAKFAPMPANEMAIRSAAVRDETTGRIYEAGIHAMAQDDAISRGAKGPFTDGFVTNRKFPGNKIEFLDRDESFARAKEIGQIPEKTTSQYAGLPQLESNAFEEGRRFSPSKERKEIELEGPDGKKYRAMFDGYMDMSLIGLGQVPQITPLENLPGSKMRGSTTYGPSLEKAGYKLPADLPDAPIAETEAKFSPPKTDEQLRTGVEFTKFFSDVASGRFGKSDVPFESLQDLSDVANVEAERMKHWGNFENHIQRSIPMIHEEKTRLADGIIKTFGEGGARLLDIGSSEGDFGKAISALTDGKIETLSLEPNPDMAANFRDISTVEGATFTGDSFLKSFEGHPAHSPSEPYDIINEAVTFQFINPNRDAQVAEVKRMLKPDGIFLSVEKFKTDRWAENEAKKDADFKDKYFTKSELAEKESRVGFEQSKVEQQSVGMVDNMVSDTSYIDTLQKNFKHVIQYWDSGNFKGFAASDNLPKLRELVSNIGDLNSEFSTVRTPREVKAAFAPNAEIKKISSEYRDEEGIKTSVRPVVTKFNEDVAKEIADYYDAQPKGVVTPAARKSYDAFNAETRKQYESLLEAGYVLEPWKKAGEPYADSAAMRKDLQDNKHLFYFPSKSGLGKGEVQKNYPPMEDSGVVINGERVPYNDLFRAVHDVFGHGTEGRTFSMDGEFQAWQDHAPMYSEAAQSALALETLGLNAWFNAGKHLRRPGGRIPKKGESDFVPLRDRDYAPRTIFEFPKELIEKAVGRNERGAAFSPKPNDPLAIKMAAVRDDTTGEIFTGVMHPVIVSKLAREGRNTDHLTDGFVTNAFKADENNQLIDGEFLNRDDTFYRALDRKQVDPKKLRSDIKEFGMMESTGFEKARKFSPPKREQFEDPETIREALSSPGWAVISNTQEALGKWNAPANLATAKALEADLREKGYEFIPVKGTYKGVPQGTDFLVADISTYDAQTLGKKYKQESVLTPKGLLYGDGTITPMDTANIMLGSEAKKQEFFSTLPNGLSFSVPLDFSKAPYQPVGEQSTLFGGREYESPANFTQAELRQKYPEAIIPKNSKEQIGSDIVGSPLYKESANPVQAFADKLVEFVNQYKDNPVYQLGLRWYSDFVPMLKKEYGADAPMVAQLLAASSPNEKPKMNFFYANDAIEGFKSGRFDKIISKFNQGFDMYKSDNWLTWYNRELKAGNIVNPPQTPTPESFLANWIYKHDLKPKQSNGQLYGFHGRAILEVMAGKWLQENKGPKVGNFVQNLLGAGHEATIDVWADRTMRRIGYADTKNRWRIMPANVEGVSDADFAFSQKAVRAAAERLGVLPDALQGGLWFAEKRLWAENGWGREDLGSYVDEMANLPMIRQAIKQRLTATKGRAKVKSMETGELKFSPKGNDRDVLKPGVYSVSTSYGATKDVEFEGGTTRQLYREYAGKVDEFGFKRMTFTGPKREKDIDVQPRPMNSNRDY